MEAEGFGEFGLYFMPPDAQTTVFWGLAEAPQGVKDRLPVT